MAGKNQNSEEKSIRILKIIKDPIKNKEYNKQK